MIEKNGSGSSTGTSVHHKVPDSYIKDIENPEKQFDEEFEHEELPRSATLTTINFKTVLKHVYSRILL